MSDPKDVATANALLDMYDGAIASHNADEKLAVGLQIYAFKEAHSPFDGDDAYLNDNLDSAASNLTGNGAGTWGKPNAYTTSAAKMQDDSISKQLKSNKFIEDLRSGLAPAFEGITKGLGSTAVKIAAAAGAVFILYIFITKKKG